MHLYNLNRIFLNKIESLELFSDIELASISKLMT